MKYEVPDKWSDSIESILASYRSHLKQKYGIGALRKYEYLYDNNREAGVSEAIIFNWLCDMKQNPALLEDLSEGGADFICNQGKDSSFVVEVTCIGGQALLDKTGCHMLPGQLMALVSLTTSLRNRVARKTSQLSDYEMPRVLIITSLHDGGYLFLNQDGAKKLLISDWAYSISDQHSNDENCLSTDLKKSIFLKPDGSDQSKIVACRQAISSVLLMPISGDRLNVIGILNPEPSYGLNIQAFPKIPFVRIKNWPVSNGVISTEWVISDPYASVYSLSNEIEKYGT